MSNRSTIVVRVRTLGKETTEKFFKSIMKNLKDHELHIPKFKREVTA